MGPRREGFTLVEVLIVAALSVLVFGSLFLFYVSSQKSSRKLQARFEAAQEGQVALRRILAEVRSARRILYPASEFGDKPGMSFIDGEGRQVLIHLSRPTAPPGKVPLGEILWQNLSTGRQEVLLGGVRDFQCRVPPGPTGRDPRLVHVSFVLEREGATPLYLISSGRILVDDPVCPSGRS